MADLLNTHAVGGHRKYLYRDDVWNIKYLKGFEWHQLAEEQRMWQRAVSTGCRVMGHTTGKREAAGSCKW